MMFLLVLFGGLVSSEAHGDLPIKYNMKSLLKVREHHSNVTVHADSGSSSKAANKAAAFKSKMDDLRKSAERKTYIETCRKLIAGFQNSTEAKLKHADCFDMKLMDACGDCHVSAKRGVCCYLDTSTGYAQTSGPCPGIPCAVSASTCCDCRACSSGTTGSTCNYSCR
eukprot:gnl/MRDRNA2_/MRDRNA2_94761_c0_seq1.p1 gnl/MRDRNA2_/MRDRNA2_94761_c0~~gnl/MRDRNA2_/MRDRNA2_94761_c0_seq1.p1  ORF type:complete len:168 (+),score=22.71 gnl/MRDRNA2_/MRDRNA2_94761_c0_seq1:57-560(+)